jgi:hypothetical protein
MDELRRAEDHLRAIRALMERATIYRALSAPTALVGGLLATTAGATMWWWWLNRPGLGPRKFTAIWCAICATTILANLAFLRASARRRGEPLFSARFRTATRDMLPAFLAAAGIGACHARALLDDGAPTVLGIAPLVISWQIFYGLALLATEEYAPHSLVVLGWTFLLAGLTHAALFYSGLVLYDGGVAHGAIVMGATFGLFHLLYAAITWPRGPEPARVSVDA